jgi:hypothetical protein
MKTYGEGKVQLRIFVTSTRDGCEWSVSRSGSFNQGTHWLGQRFSTGVPRHTGVTRWVRRCAAGVWGERRKEARRKLRNKKITLPHGADYFIQNLIFHYFIEKKRGYVTERGGHFFEASGIRYRIFFINDTFFNISFQYLE